jgi:KaiC/GvpD/RAD55 family RecA-like ATPase
MDGILCFFEMNKIKSGVYGLNKLLDGGINENTATVIIGGTGAGKTTLAMQFLRRGLELGDDGVFITLDEAPEQLILEATMMGWADIEESIKKGLLVFIDASGKEFSNFIEKELASFVDEWAGHKARIVIDPLTPVLWSVNERYEQRELVSFLLRETRKIGTVLCTLEEYGTADLSGDELVIPMYLADNVIHLKYATQMSPEKRELKIIKCRSSKHSRFWHPYDIARGVGLFIKQARQRSMRKSKGKIGVDFMEKLTSVPKEKFSKLSAEAMENIRRTMDTLSREGHIGEDAEKVIELIFEEYDLT